MGSQDIAKQYNLEIDPAFSLQRATIDDLDELIEVQFTAMSWDPLVGSLLSDGRTISSTSGLTKPGIALRLTVGEELGLCQTWKVVDTASG